MSFKEIWGINNLPNNLKFYESDDNKFTEGK